MNDARVFVAVGCCVEDARNALQEQIREFFTYHRVEQLTAPTLTLQQQADGSWVIGTVIAYGERRERRVY